MKNYIRIREYAVLIYRIFLVYFFYFLARILFAVFNWELLDLHSIKELLRLCYYGIQFDTTAILYSNALFILLSIAPFFINTNKKYQKFLKIIYFAFNLPALALNFIDLIYYRFTFNRSTINIFESIENETNLPRLFIGFLNNFWYVFLLFFIFAFVWIFLYSKVKVKKKKYSEYKIGYIASSLVGILIIGVLTVGGIRGDFKKSTRPINMVDAGRHVKQFVHANVVLNTPFCIIRTIGKTSFRKEHFMYDSEAEAMAAPIKQYNRNEPDNLNIVIFILESYSREYIGAFNKDKGIEGYVSYTPFLDSLSEKSMIFTNAFANGYKSIHGMSSVLAGIPSFKDAFTSSPFPNQDIQSLVSILNEEGYDTSFFHGAPNGSMGFLGFGNILGIQHYYGKTEYDNDEDFDGVWGIWDEPFLQFTNRILSEKKQPFMATVFTITSHEPFQVPKEFEGKFPKGNVQMHQVVGYTDYALKKFFEAAAREPWFENTLFVLTADHDNQSDYKFYQNGLNKQAVPIILYKPNSNLKGISDQWAQQIDIYPTIMDLIGYQKPFRSWGVSLMGDPENKPFVINYLDNTYRYASGDYICVFDGKKAVGFFDKNDTELKNNLIGQRNPEMDEVETACKAFLQNYFQRIMDQELNEPSSNIANK